MWWPGSVSSRLKAIAPSCSPSTSDNTRSECGPLPNLLYLGDVPIESSYHGSALLYRLLQDYPPRQLLIIEAGQTESLPERRLADVRYRRLDTPSRRMLNTRFTQWAGSWITIKSFATPRGLDRLCGDFASQAILTVAHGYGWMAAAKLAEVRKLPLHLIVHDHCPSTLVGLPWVRPWQERLFAKAYQNAAARFCVSPFMEDQYRRDFGVPGAVLYPSRARGVESAREMPSTYSKRSGKLIGAYAGSIFSAGYANQIATVAERLDARGGTLLLFGPHSRESLAPRGLARKNIVVCGLLNSQELMSRIRQEADFLFVPMDFASDNQQNMRLSFPSKLTDYTATGLPLLIWGPEYSSAVAWAQRHAPLAEIVISQSPQDIDAALDRLQCPEHRRRIGTAAAQVGDRLFSHHSAVASLYDGLRGHGPTDSRVATTAQR